MAYGYIVRISYPTALQLMADPSIVDEALKERMEQDRIAHAKYLCPYDKLHGGWPLRQGIENAGKILDRNEAIDLATSSWEYAQRTTTEKSKIVEVISLEDNLLVWRSPK